MLLHKQPLQYIIKQTLFLGVVAMLACCSVPKKAVKGIDPASFKYNYCDPVIPYQQSLALWHGGTSVDLTETQLPLHDQVVCRIIGISSLVDSLWLINHKRILMDSTRAILLRQKITGRIMVVQSQLQAIAAELDCEGERSNLAANYLDIVNNRKKTNLTVASVVIGALTTVATVLVTNKPGQAGIAIGGGLASGVLGVMTINPKGKTIAFYHHRNLLQTIWTEPAENKDYPYFVWAMLHEKQFSNSGDITLAQSIRRRWLQFEFEEKVTPGQETLFFGKGGLYHADELHSRAAMINQLQSTIRSFNQDLAGIIVFTEQL